MSNNRSTNGERPISELRFPEFEGLPIHTVCLGDVTEEPSLRNHGHLPPEFVMGVRKDDGIVPMEDRLVAADTTRYKIVRNDWFAYNPMRLNIGSIARWQGKEDVLVSPDYVVFRCLEQIKPTRLLPSYLDQFRQANQWDSFVNRSGDGGVRVRIYYRDLARLQLLLPDVPEQEKIAACLSTLDGLIESEADKLTALEHWRLGLAQQLFPVAGEKKPRQRFPAFKGATDWKGATLRDLCRMKAGKFVAAAEISEDDKDELHPCYGGNGLRGYTSTSTHSGSYILIGRQGALCGNVNLVTGKFHATEHAIVTAPRKGVALDWLYHALAHLKLNDFATGQAQPGLSVEGLEKISCPVPRDEQEQRLIADALSSIARQISLHSSRLEALRVHKNGLMQKLFPSTKKAGT